jgi:thymidylate synthase
LALNDVRIWHDWALKKYLKAVNANISPGTPEWKEELNRFDEKIKADAEFAEVWGELGPVYSRQWRNWERWESTDGWARKFDLVHLDQIANLVNDLKNNPYSRRHIVSAWNPPDIPNMALPPCHTLWQCYVNEHVTTARTTKELSLHLYARSIDSFLGLPFNIASYAMLLTMLSKVTGMTPGELVISFGDLHLYRNHFEQAKLQLTREPRKLPQLMLPVKEKLEDYVFDDFQIVGYDPHPAIKAPISV